MATSRANVNSLQNGSDFGDVQVLNQPHALGSVPRLILCLGSLSLFLLSVLLCLFTNPVIAHVAPSSLRRQCTNLASKISATVALLKLRALEDTLLNPVLHVADRLMIRRIRPAALIHNASGATRSPASRAQMTEVL